MSFDKNIGFIWYKIKLLNNFRAFVFYFQDPFRMFINTNLVTDKQNAIILYQTSDFSRILVTTNFTNEMN